MKTLRMLINTGDSRGIINKNIYGQFIEQTGHIVNDGLYVGEDSPIPNKNGVRKDVLEAFHEICVPLLHWPGGYTTEFYHWRNGIGPKECRSRIPDTLTGRDSGAPQFVDSNAFGTHEFFDLCEELGAEPYLVFGSGQVSVEEIHDRVEYITFDGDSTLAELRRKNSRKKPWKLRYMTVGNGWWFYESAASYAVRYSRAIHFARNYSCHNPFRVMRGPQMEDIHYTNDLTDPMESIRHISDVFPSPARGYCDAITLYMVMSEVRFG